MMSVIFLLEISKYDIHIHLCVVYMVLILFSYSV